MTDAAVDWVTLGQDFTGPLTFGADVSEVEVDVERRIIRGLVLPFNVVGNNGKGKFFFTAAAVPMPTDPTRVKLMVAHDPASACGHATEFEVRPAGIWGVFKVDSSPEGDRALQKASEKTWDGLSAGIDPRKGRFQLKAGVYHALEAPFWEVSLTPLPAFDDARVTSVAASAAPNRKEPVMGDENEPGTDTGTGTETATAETGAVDLSAITTAISEGFAGLVNLAAPPEGGAPAAGRPVGLAITEPSLYRFDGVRGTYDFSADLIAGMGLGTSNPAPDGEAYDRVLTFMAEQFGPQFVTTTDTGALNPTGYRPDMFVNEQRLTTPLLNAFYKGALTDVTPFTFSKFSAAAGLVGDHTQGTEPTPGSYSTATAATVTPTPVSGKVHITREVGDQGGNPQISALIWSKIDYEYRKSMENKVAALLGAATPAELGAAIAAAASTVATLADPLEKAIAGLNFVAGGNRYDYIAAHLDLYLAMAGLRDGQNRPYYPILNAVNANGTTANQFQSLNVAGNRFDPVWSIGTVSDGTPHKSYVADRSSVWFWHTAPQRLDKLQEKVEGWDLGVWGYQAGVISDPTGLKKITYDPV